jgi:hypothetical protein
MTISHLASRFALATAMLAVLSAPTPLHAAVPVPVVRDTLVPDTGAVARAAAPAATDSAAPAAAPRHVARLTVHGYLTQGFAVLRGPVQFYGITDRGSADFRYAALQARYALGARDLVLVQANHRRLGRSPITDFESTVNLNWAFYEHTFGDGTDLKVGRVPIPRGIYNQLRSVGVALPTYRPPVVFYDEGAYYSETINGVVASHTFAADRAWNVEAHLYAGGWRSLFYDTWSDTYAVTKERMRDAVGGQFWLQTPLDGVRLGAAAQRYSVPDSDVIATSEVKEYHVSFDATREHGFVRAEAQLQNYGTDKFYSAYVQLGAPLVGRLHGVVELQRARDTDVRYGDGSLPSSFAWHRSDGVGLSYVVSPQLVFKTELHRDRGIQLEQPGDPLSPPRFRYVMASVSASF